MHAMSHPISAYFDVPHGVANAILLPTVVDFNKDAADPEKYRYIYGCISKDMGQILILHRTCLRQKSGC